MFRAGFLTPASALEGACKLTLILLLHAVYPWKSAAITPPHPAALTGHTGSVLFPFLFLCCKISTKFRAVLFPYRGTCCPDKSVTLVFTCAGRGEGKSSTVPLGGVGGVEGTPFCGVSH